MTATADTITTEQEHTDTSEHDHAESTLPVFHSQIYEEHVQAWRLVDTKITFHHWQLAAIAASLVRSVGGRPRSKATTKATKAEKVSQQLEKTQIQRFCQDVGIGTTTFYRLTHTYRKFAETQSSGGMSYIGLLSFTHHEIASRLAPDDPVTALAKAHEKNESTKQLALRLAPPPPDPKPFSDDAAKLALLVMMSKWPEEQQRHSPEILQSVREELIDPKSSLTPRPEDKIKWVVRIARLRESDLSDTPAQDPPPQEDDEPAYVHDTTTDYNDPIGAHEEEAMA